MTNPKLIDIVEPRIPPVFMDAVVLIILIIISIKFKPVTATIVGSILYCVSYACNTFFDLCTFAVVLDDKYNKHVDYDFPLTWYNKLCITDLWLEEHLSYPKNHNPMTELAPSAMIKEKLYRADLYRVDENCRVEFIAKCIYYFGITKKNLISKHEHETIQNKILIKFC